jgi:hypothetical protein
MKNLYVESDMTFRYIDVMCKSGGLTEDDIPDARKVADSNIGDEIGDWRFWEAEVADEYTITFIYGG